MLILPSTRQKSSRQQKKFFYFFARGPRSLNSITRGPDNVVLVECPGNLNNNTDDINRNYNQGSSSSSSGPRSLQDQNLISPISHLLTKVQKMQDTAACGVRKCLTYFQKTANTNLKKWFFNTSFILNMRSLKRVFMFYLSYKKCCEYFCVVFHEVQVCLVCWCTRKLTAR